MRIRGEKRTIIVLITVLFVLIVAGGVTTALLVQRAHHKNDVKAANKVAANFEKKADKWRKTTLEDLSGARHVGSDYASVSKKVDEKISTVPKVGSAPAYGKAHSKAYKSAQEREGHLTDGLDEVKKAAKVATTQTAWVGSAQAALSITVDDILPSATVKSSKALRSKVVPRFKNQIKRFQKEGTRP